MVSENRLHKRRQRKRNQDKKKNDLNELMERVTSSLDDISENDDDANSILDLYKPIKIIHDNDKNDASWIFELQDFWKTVPPICNPCRAILNDDISDTTKLQKDKQNQGKYERKLNIKLQRGEITESQRNSLWMKHSRSSSSPSATTTTTNNFMSKEKDEGGVKLLSLDRGQRKAWQIENFAVLLYNLLQHRQQQQQKQESTTMENPFFTVVDFGCGSGNLCLALASYFTNVRFVLADKKEYPLKLAERRAREASLTNVECMQYTFSPDNLNEFVCPPLKRSISQDDDTITTNEDDDVGNNNISQRNNSPQRRRSFDIGIGLHCCGSFTDMVMELCLIHGADCIVCPCCNGGMTSKATCGYQYPRSSIYRTIINQDEYLQRLSKSADVPPVQKRGTLLSEQNEQAIADTNSDIEHYKAKCLVEYDRALWARENGFQQVELWKLTPVECTPKHHVLCLQV